MLLLLIVEPAIGQADQVLNQAFEQIKYYQSKGKATQQVCEMMNTESLLSELGFDQAQKSKYYMDICLTKVDISSVKDKSEVLGRAMEYSGIRHYVFGDYDKSVVAFDASLVLLKPFGLQYRIHRWLGLIHSLNENISLGIHQYEEAIVEAERYYSQEDPQGDAFIFSLHSNVTSAYSKLENFRKAKYHAHLALKYAQKLSDKSLIATATINEANILISENKAQEALDELAHLDTLVTDEMQIAVNYYNILGTAYQQIKEYDLSIENFEKSNRLIANNSVQQDGVVLNRLAIAEAQLLKGSYSRSLSTIQKVIDELETKQGQFRSSLGDAYHIKSKGLIAMDQYQLAEAELKKAIEIKGPFETWKLPQLSTMVSIKAAQYQASGDELYLTSLIKYQALTDSLILDLQIEHRHFEDEINLNEYIYQVYSKNLAIASQLQQKNSNKLDPALIFKYMETLKSFGLRKERKANVKGLNIPDDLLIHISELKYKLTKLQKDKHEFVLIGKNTEEIDSAYAETKYNYYAVLDVIEAEFPQYYKGQFQKSNPELASVQEELNPSELLVEYFLSDETIYVIGITKDSLHFVSTAKPEDWDVLLDSFRQSLTNIDLINQPKNYLEVFNVFSRSGLRLYDLLLKELLTLFPEAIRELKIIPDNELYYIPFKVLLSSPSISSTYQDLNYLGRKYELSYSESTAHLFQNQSEQYADSYTVLTPDYTAESAWKPLPISYQASLGIVKELKGRAIQSDEAASSFLFSHPSSAVLHFAGHAGITADPSLSGLMLENKTIYTADIYQMEMENQLTILSACNTGNGKFINGRGLQSLSRAFRYAGAQSTIQSLWSLPELQTTQLNQKIISNLSSGIKIQSALQQAQFALLDESPKLYSHPFYWAGYVTFGSSDQVVNLNIDQAFHLWQGVLAFFALFCLFYLWKKSR